MFIISEVVQGHKRIDHNILDNIPNNHQIDQYEIVTLYISMMAMKATSVYLEFSRYLHLT